MSFDLEFAKRTPLLSIKPLCMWTPEDFKTYVRSLYFKRNGKSKTIKLKKPFTFRLNAKGSLVLQVNREPKWLSREEVDSIAAATGLPLNDVWVKVLKKKVKNPITISTEEEQRAIKARLADIPW